MNTRETNSVAFCLIQQMSIKQLFLYMELKWLTLLLIKSAQPIIKWGGIQPMQWWNLYTLIVSLEPNLFFFWRCLSLGIRWIASRNVLLLQKEKQYGTLGFYDWLKSLHFIMIVCDHWAKKRFNYLISIEGNGGFWFTFFCNLQIVKIGEKPVWNINNTNFYLDYIAYIM